MLMRRHNIAFAALALVSFSTLLGACGKGEGGGISAAGADDSSPVLARVGRERLHLAQACRDLPGGLSPDDSARFVKGIVYAWVDKRLVAEMAPEDLDMSEIDRLTSEYREALIAEAYRRRIAEEGTDATFSEDSMKTYYEEHKADFRLREPLVKGVYVKVPANASNIASIRRLMRSDAPADIDRLEKEVISSNAIHYDYFRERWIDWDRIEVRIPYDFGDIGAFLRPGRFLDTTTDGYTYLLRVTEVLPASATMPFEAAREEVRERLLAERRRQIDASFRADLLRRALDTGRAEIFL